MKFSAALRVALRSAEETSGEPDPPLIHERAQDAAKAAPLIVKVMALRLVCEAILPQLLAV